MLFHWGKRVAAISMAAFSLTSIATLHAQVGTATLSGLITDPSGASVPKGQVTIESTERKFTRRTVTDELGAYVFTALPPGAYQIDVTAPAFREEKVSDVVLSSGQASTLNVTMKLLASNEQVTVTEAPP